MRGVDVLAVWGQAAAEVHVDSPQIVYLRGSKQRKLKITLVRLVVGLGGVQLRYEG